MQFLNDKSACIDDLKQRAKRRIPAFAFDYVSGGCNQEISLQHNRVALDAVRLRPDYLTPFNEPILSQELFNRTYNIPLGIAPLGLAGIAWPNAALLHAKAAKQNNIPFILSTVSTCSIEQAATAAEENFWFQLYPPSDENILKDLMDRAKAVECKHLVVTVDVPAIGRRPKEMKGVLSTPPRVKLSTIYQTLLSPHWSLATAMHGKPEFASLKPYMKDISKMKDVNNYIRNNLKDVVDFDKLKSIRDTWSDKLIVKGINHIDDALRAVSIGVDGIIVSNHGGRQLDAAQSPIEVIKSIREAVPNHISVMADSGIESGVDIARYLAHGADFVFTGRGILYGVAAHGEVGAQHAIDIFREELEQVLQQLHCGRVLDLPRHLIVD